MGMNRTYTIGQLSGGATVLATRLFDGGQDAKSVTCAVRDYMAVNGHCMDLTSGWIRLVVTVAEKNRKRV